jgi:hypothetical protein
MRSVLICVFGLPSLLYFSVSFHWSQVMTEPKISAVSSKNVHTEPRRLMRIYLSGPISNLPDLNFPAFNSAAADLRYRGFDVFTPSEIELNPNWEWHDYMAVDIPEVVKADAVYVLPGWQKSTGAPIEVALAHWLKKPIYDYTTGAEFVPDVHLEVFGGSESPLEAAQRLVYGNRNKSYDHPFTNFTNIGKIWEGIKGIPFSPEDVALMMAGVKLARESFKHKLDNIRDGVGYLATLDRIHKRRRGEE